MSTDEEVRRYIAAAASQAAEIASMQAAERMKGFTRDYVEEIVAETVAQILTRLGMEAEDPMEMQKDMQHLRRWRTSVESVQSKGILTIIGVALSGALAAFWLGFREMMGK